MRLIAFAKLPDCSEVARIDGNFPASQKEDAPKIKIDIINNLAITDPFYYICSI